MPGASCPVDDESAELLGPDGPFVSTIAGFQPRRSQVRMADTVARCLHDNSVFVVESGTGTGKTFAYLVPAILSGKRIIISTGTKPLQDQLYHRDLPAVMRTLGATAKIALLKGRANYLCLYRLQGAGQQTDLLSDRRAREFAAVERWAHSTASGDLNEMTGIADDSPLRALVTSTTENCIGAKCASYEECYVNQARRSALAADILVINHHLFCADLVLREDGFGQILPGADAVIFDEAHQLAEVATNFLGVSLSSNQVRELCRDTRAEEQREAEPGAWSARMRIECGPPTGGDTCGQSGPRGIGRIGTACRLSRVLMICWPAWCRTSANSSTASSWRRRRGRDWRGAGNVHCCAQSDWVDLLILPMTDLCVGRKPGSIGSGSMKRLCSLGDARTPSPRWPQSLVLHVGDSLRERRLQLFLWSAGSHNWANVYVHQPKTEFI